MNLLALIPMPYRIAAVAALILVTFLAGWVKGLQHDQYRIDAMIAKAQAEGVRIVTKRGEVTTQVVTKYVAQAAKVQVVTETITKEIPVYVPLSTPDLPGGFRLLHDAAATGSVPDPARRADAAAVPAQDAAGTVTENYGLCRADQLRLQSLQEWVDKQAKVKP